jgi:hypothetical protein
MAFSRKDQEHRMAIGDETIDAMSDSYLFRHDPCWRLQFTMPLADVDDVLNRV